MAEKTNEGPFSRIISQNMNVILSALVTSPGLTITADYLVKELLMEKKLKLIWKGLLTTDNTLYLVYDKTKVTTEQIKLARMLYKHN